MQKNNKNWQTKKLGEVCDLIKGRKPKSFSKTGNPYLTAKSIRGSESPQLTKEKENIVFVKSEDVVIIMDGSNSGEIFQNLKGVLASTMGVLAFNKRKISPRFLLYFLVGYREEFTKSRTGSAIPHLNKDQFNDLLFPIISSDEQKRIVKILDGVFADVEKAKDNAQHNLKNAKELFESYLQSVFENGKLKNKNEKWEEKKLGELGKVSMCKRIFKDQTLPMGDIPFYKIGTFGKKPNAFISQEIYDEFKKKFSFPKKGDILISASGTIGRRVVYDGRDAYFQDSNIVWIDNDETKVLNELLYYFYGECNWNASKGATISRLYNSDLKAIEFSFPKSLKTQKQIVKKLDELSEQTKKLEKIYEQKLIDLEELKKSVLKKAFEGKL